MARGGPGRIERPCRISFQATATMKLLHDAAKVRGHHLTELYAAGLLLVLEDREARAHALQRLRKWGAEFGSATFTEIRAFLASVEGAG
jgi:hypothetical protein